MSTVRVQFHAVDIRAEGFETDDDGDYFDGAVNFDIAVEGAVQRNEAVHCRLGVRHH